MRTINLRLIPTCTWARCTLWARVNLCRITHTHSNRRLWRPRGDARAQSTLSSSAAVRSPQSANTKSMRACTSENRLAGCAKTHCDCTSADERRRVRFTCSPSSAVAPSYASLNVLTHTYTLTHSPHTAHTNTLETFNSIYYTPLIRDY